MGAPRCPTKGSISARAEEPAQRAVVEPRGSISARAEEP